MIVQVNRHTANPRIDSLQCPEFGWDVFQRGLVQARGPASVIGELYFSGADSDYAKLATARGNRHLDFARCLGVLADCRHDEFASKRRR